MPPLTDPNAKPTEDNFREFVSYLFQSKRYGLDGLLHGAVGMSGESGEVLDIVKKSWVYDRDLPIDKIMEELGDTLHYMFMVLIKLEEITGVKFTLADLIRNNMVKLNKRYPDGFSKAAAIARADVGPERPA